MTGWRARFRDSAESALTSLDAPALARRAYGDRRVILSYHNVVSDPGAAHGDTSLHLPLPAFCAQMRELVAHFTVVSLAALRSPASHLDKPRVAITFDDAEAGVYLNAMPALKARDMTATIYVVTQWVGRSRFMTWDQLREARDQGISIQSHTCSHPFLSELEPDALRVELGESKRILDRELGQDTNEIAFPGGDPPRHGLRRIIQEEGYRYAVGTRWGTNADDFGATVFAKRCTFRGDTTREHARRVIHGDARLAIGEASKETVLRNLRAFVGPSRYAYWRRLLLNRFTGDGPG